MNYPHYLTWLRQSSTTASSGSKEESFSSNGYLWGRVEEIAGRRNEDYGSMRTGAEGIIYINNRVTDLSAKDRLSFQGREWRIDRMRFMENETVVDVWCHDVEVA